MIGTKLDGRYHIISRLGGGSFGETFVAEDIRKWGRQCVVKRFRPPNNDPYTVQQGKRLFELEAKILAKLGEHDKIPDLIDFFEENQDFYLVQELIIGGSLRGEFLAHKKLTEEQILQFLEDALGVLKFVHDNQVIHRDIKPDNLMRRRKDDRIVLIDFGAVKDIQAQLINAQGQTVQTVSGTRIGTFGYTPMEQLAGNPQFNSDIYALGMTAIEGLIGVMPSKLKADPVTGEVIWKSQVQVSDRLATIIDQMILSNYENRYQSVHDVLDDINRLKAPIVSTLIKPLPPTILEPAPSTIPPSVPPTPSSSMVNSVLIKWQTFKAWYWLFLLFIVAAPVAYFIIPKPRTFLTTPTTKNPQSVDLFRQGDELLKTNQYEEALEAFRSAIKLQPEYAEAWNAQGWALFRLNRLEEAIVSYDQAIKIRPSFALSLTNKGTALAQLNRYDEAIEYYNKALQIQPNFPEALSDRGWAFYKKNLYSQALDDYNHALAISPNFLNALKNKSFLLIQANEFEAARQVGEQALKINPNDAVTLNTLGFALANLKRYEEAIAAYDKAIELDQNFQIAKINRESARRQLAAIK